jgi:hypothetical protein
MNALRITTCRRTHFCPTKARLFEGIDLLDLAIDRALTYRPAADGQRFLVSAAAGGDAAVATPLTVVTNWTAGLKK